jgi:hypothetical protein
MHPPLKSDFPAMVLLSTDAKVRESQYILLSSNPAFLEVSPMLFPRNLQSLTERSQQGATLAFVAAVTVIVCIVGVFLFFVLGMIGGSRETQNATDSGNLNLGKQAILHPDIQLNTGVEQDNFAGLTDQNGNVNLANYNRLTAQAIIVAANAQAEGTTEAKTNLQTLTDTFQSGQDSISKRLHDALASAAKTDSIFSSLALSNSTRMVKNNTPNNVDAGYQTAYVDKASPTNVTLDQNILPAGATLPSNALSSTNGGSGKPYINGYTDITFTGMPAVAGASVHPGQQPHLISDTEFKGSRSNPVTAGAVPPNSFQSVSTTKVSTISSYKNTSLVNLSCSTVGSLKQEFQASIPRGYIVVTNPSGFQFNGNLPNPDSIYNNQLYTGLYLGSNGAFSTSEDAMQAWVDYNNASSTPSSTPPTDGIYNSNGDPLSASDGKGITSLGGGTNKYPTEADYTMVTGDGKLDQVVGLLKSMEKAYDAPNSQKGNHVELTAVEDLKGNVMTMFASQLTGKVPAPSGSSGLRLFNHQQQLPVAAGAPPLISDSGNVVQLLNQIGDQTIMPQLKQRIHEIKPSASDNEIMTMLKDNLVGLGETWYIYMDQSTGALKMKQTAPSWVANLPTGYQDGTKADGSPMHSSTTFETIGYSVDPPGEAGFNSNLYDITSDPTSTGLATDESIWTPSSGFNNLLGTLSFGESITDVSATTPSPTPPTTCSTCTPQGCTFPWDTAAQALGPNASVNDVIASMVANGASTAFYHPGGSWSQVQQTFAAYGYNQSNMSWDAATYVYFNSTRPGQLVYNMYGGYSSPAAHSYSGTEMYASSGLGNWMEVRQWRAQPGSGQGFLNWFDQQNCGSTFVIVDTIN